MKISIIAMALVLLSGCAQTLPSESVSAYVAECKKLGGSPDFILAGKYDSGSIIRVNCYHGEGMTTFPAIELGGRPAKSTVGKNQLGIPENNG